MKLILKLIIKKISVHPSTSWLIIYLLKISTMATFYTAILRGFLSNKKPKFVMHVGSPKTATTTLQQDIFPYHSQIANIIMGWRVFFSKIWKEYPFHIFLYSLYFYIYLKVKNQNNFQKFPPKMAQKRLLYHNPSSKNPTFVISEESFLLRPRFDNLIKELPAIPKSMRRRIKIMYVIRKEENALTSMFLHKLSWEMHQGHFDDILTPNQFTKMAREDFTIDSTKIYTRVFVNILRVANKHVYNPRVMLEEIFPRLSDNINVLPYELLVENPDEFLERVSDIMEIDPTETKRLYHLAQTKKEQHTNMHFISESGGSRGMAMRQRGLDFYNAFVSNISKYNRNPQSFKNDAKKYAATLPTKMQQAVLASLTKIDESADLSQQFQTIYETEPLATWIREGGKAKVTFSPKELEQLRKIRAPQNRWIAKKFNLDLARYGYSM